MEALATEAGKAFLTQGILGSLVLILLGAVVFLYRESRSTDQKRFEELQKIIDARESVAKALNTNSLALEANNRSMDLRTRATEEMAREVAELRQELLSAVKQGDLKEERVREKIDEILKKIENCLRGAR